MPIMTGLSGNEMFCLNLKGYSPGELVIGNSVFSMGFAEGARRDRPRVDGRRGDGDHQHHSRGPAGGLRPNGARGAVARRDRDHRRHQRAADVSRSHRIPLRRIPLHHGGATRAVDETIEFSTSAGQELYCQLDAGFSPVKFVFGNVAYSVGVGGSILGKFKSLARGEIKEFSDVFNRTRHLALERIVSDARAAGADAVVGIETRTVPFAGVHEMLMMGTASRHPALSILNPPAGKALPYESSATATKHAAYPGQPISSDLTNEEMWNVVHMGYMPLKLVLGTAVYSLGVIGGIKAMLKGFARGEIPELTSLIYDGPRTRDRPDPRRGQRHRRRRRRRH